MSALEPCYGSRGGNAVRVYTRDGKVYQLDQSLKSMIKLIASYFSIDLQAARKKSNTILGRSLNPPLPFSLKMLLVPFKMRCPRFPKDGATGYINLRDYIEAVPVKRDKDGLPRTIIRLTNGHSLGSLNVPAKCRQYIKDAKLVKAYYHKVQGQSDPDQLMPFSGGKSEKWQRFDRRMIIYLANDESDNYTENL